LSHRDRWAFGGQRPRGGRHHPLRSSRRLGRRVRRPEVPEARRPREYLGTCRTTRRS